MNTLQMSANAPLPSDEFVIEVVTKQGIEIDVSALQIYADGKVRGDDDMCFYNQPWIAGGAIELNKPKRGLSVFSFIPSRVPSDVAKVVITATLDGAGRTFSAIPDLHVNVEGGG